MNEASDSDPAHSIDSRPGAPLSAFTASQLLTQRVLDPPTRPGLLGRVDRFEVIRMLGAGGMGVVFLARDPAKGDEVAVKLLHPDLAGQPQAARQFLREANHMHGLNHANIVQVFEFSDRERGPYYVMEYMEKGPLSRLIGGEPLDFLTTMKVAKDVAQALRFAHTSGITHRDLKPANVLFGPDGRACLSDFGLAQTFHNDSMIDVRCNQRMGTAPYMSPAVARGEAEDTRRDIYAFGAVLYEMLTGKNPYTGPTAADVLAQILAGPPKQIIEHNPAANPGLVRIAEGAMARELRHRYANMKDIVADLTRVEENEPPVGPHDEARAWRPPVLRGFAIVLALLLAIGAIVGWRLLHAGNQTPGSKEPFAAGSQPANGPTILSWMGRASSAVPSYLAKPAEVTIPLRQIALSPGADGRIVDLLPMVNLNMDTVAGLWTQHPDGLESKVPLNKPRAEIKLEFPYAPPEEYDFEIVFVVKGGTDTTNFVCCGAGRQFVWTVFPDHGVFSAMEGRRNDNSTAKPLAIVEGRRYTTLVRVRRSGVRAYLDGVPVTAVGYTGLSLDPTFALRRSDTVGIGVWGNRVLIESAKISEISGPGKMLRAPAPATSRPGARSVDLLPLVNIDTDPVTGTWTKKHDSLHCELASDPPYQQAKFEFPYAPPEEYDFEIVFVAEQGTGPSNFICCGEGRQFVWTIFPRVGVFSNVEGKVNVNSTARPISVVNGKRYTTLVKVRRTGVRAYLDGVLITGVGYNGLSLDPPFALRRSDTLGISIWGSQVTIESAKVTEISGSGKMLRVPGPVFPAGANQGSRAPD